MKIVKNPKTENFTPYDISIKIETKEDEVALRELILWNTSRIALINPIKKEIITGIKKILLESN